MGSVKGEDYPVSLRSEQASSTSGGDIQHLADTMSESTIQSIAVTAAQLYDYASAMPLERLAAPSRHRADPCHFE